MSNVPLSIEEKSEQQNISPNQSIKTPSVTPSKFKQFQSDVQQSLLEFLSEEREARKDLQNQIQLIYGLVPKPNISTTDRRSGVSPTDKPILESESNNDYLQQLAQQSNPFSTSMGTSNAPISDNLQTNLSSPPLTNSPSSLQIFT